MDDDYRDLTKEDLERIDAIVTAVRSWIPDEGILAEHFWHTHEHYSITRQAIHEQYMEGAPRFLLDEAHFAAIVLEQLMRGHQRAPRALYASNAVCAEPGCPELTQETYCIFHELERGSGSGG